MISFRLLGAFWQHLWLLSHQLVSTHDRLVSSDQGFGCRGRVAWMDSGELDQETARTAVDHALRLSEVVGVGPPTVR